MTTQKDRKSSGGARTVWTGIMIALLAGIVIGAAMLTGQQSAEIVAQPVSTSGLEPAPRAGHPAPDFTLTTLDGEEISLQDFAGKPVILNFWASWCGPCRLEMPHLQAAHTVYQGEEVVVLGVNLTKREGNREDIPAFLDEFGITFPVVLDEEGEVALAYEVRGQPASVFINAGGEVQTVFYGPVNEAFINEQIDELLKT